MGQRAEVVLSEEEREVLERWARRPRSSQALAFRCRVVLAAAEGRSSTEIAAQLGCNLSTVGRWRGRFAKRSVNGLIAYDSPFVSFEPVRFQEGAEKPVLQALEDLSQKLLLAKPD
jgi:Homeodomain-like domain-containing protein